MTNYSTMLRRLVPKSYPRKGENRHFLAKKNAIQSIPVSVEELRQLIPIRNLPEEELATFSQSQQSEVFPAGSILFSQGENITSVLYLLRGRVTIDGQVAIDAAGKSGLEIVSDSLPARFPLSSGNTHSITAKAKTDVHVVRVPSGILESGNSHYHLQHTDIDSLLTTNLHPQLKSSALFHTFCSHFCQNQVELPTLPSVAIKLNNALAKDIGIAEAAHIVQLDPAISARLIKIANSPLYLAAKPAENCLEAINRFGLQALKHLVTSLSLKQTFRCTSNRFRKIVESTWKQSVYLSSLCYLLASNTRTIDPEQALLAGLMCDIGIIPFLHYASEFPEELYDPGEIERAIPLLRGPVGVAILKKWDFPSELTTLPAVAEDWLYDSGADLSVSDIIVLAKLHRYMGTENAAQFPLMNTIPSFAKFSQGQLTPDTSLQLLNSARKRTEQIARFLM